MYGYHPNTHVTIMAQSFTPHWDSQHLLTVHVFTSALIILQDNSIDVGRLREYCEY